MARAMKKAYEVDCWRWEKVGDGPDVEGLGTDNPGKEVVEYISKRGSDNSHWKDTCRRCGAPSYVHGMLLMGGKKSRNEIVCPGDWIVRKDPSGFRCLTPKEFEEYYELISETGEGVQEAGEIEHGAFVVDL